MNPAEVISQIVLEPAVKAERRIQRISLFRQLLKYRKERKTVESFRQRFGVGPVFFERNMPLLVLEKGESITSALTILSKIETHYPEIIEEECKTLGRPITLEHANLLFQQNHEGHRYRDYGAWYEYHFPKSSRKRLAKLRQQ